MHRDEAPPTPLERRERRPTGTLLFLAALFALPIGTCGGIGATKAAASRKAPIETTVAELVAPGSAIDVGDYVSLDANVRHVATDELPIGRNLVVVARGTSVYAVEGAEGLFVAYGAHELASGDDVHIDGRLCSHDAHIVCSVDDGLKAFLRAEQKRSGRQPRVISVGETPAGNLVEAGIGLGVAGALLLGLLFTVMLILRGRRGPRLSVESVITIRDATEAGRIHERLGPRFRVAHTSPERLVLLTGHPASRAQLVGAVNPESYPQRVEIWLSVDGYRQASARVRVSEIFAQPAGVPAALVPSVTAVLGRTLEGVTRVLQGP
jgi:hypothetical protein